jgi:hypothetical protein
MVRLSKKSSYVCACGTYPIFFQAANGIMGLWAGAAGSLNFGSDWKIRLQFVGRGQMAIVAEGKQSSRGFSRVVGWTNNMY